MRHSESPLGLPDYDMKRTSDRRAGLAPSLVSWDSSIFTASATGESTNGSMGESKNKSLPPDHVIGIVSPNVRSARLHSERESGIAMFAGTPMKQYDPRYTREMKHDTAARGTTDVGQNLYIPLVPDKQGPRTRVPRRDISRGSIIFV
ncbi:hypothetical protein LTR74_002283 [Friedmanniomyces endolithicus]|nr:hypothetical protein LTR74_002283 [Friedmanniomyces endolithicus]